MFLLLVGLNIILPTDILFCEATDESFGKVEVLLKFFSLAYH